MCTIRLHKHAVSLPNLILICMILQEGALDDPTFGSLNPIIQWEDQYIVSNVFSLKPKNLIIMISFLTYDYEVMNLNFIIRICFSIILWKA